jgi:hypothetical protein
MIDLYLLVRVRLHGDRPSVHTRSSTIAINVLGNDTLLNLNS